MVFVGVLAALVAPATMALVTDLVTPYERGTAMSGFNVSGSLGVLCGRVAGSWLATRYGYFGVFAVAGGLEVAIAILTPPVFFRTCPIRP